VFRRKTAGFLSGETGNAAVFPERPVGGIVFPAVNRYICRCEKIGEMEIFPYGRTETDYLIRRDPRLGRAIEAIGPIARPVRTDLFHALCDSIIGQQISNRVAATVSVRFGALLGAVTPERVLAADPSALRGCGLSSRKVGYILSGAAAVRDGTLDIASLGGLSDAEVVRRLTALPGVGVWTAEMLMIFSLCRPDVLSYDDLIVRRSLMRLHSLPEIDRKRFAAFREMYSPFGSVASLYLWEMASDRWRDGLRFTPGEEGFPEREKER